MPRAAVEIRLSEVERRELENLSRAHKVWQSLARRARIVLLTVEWMAPARWWCVQTIWWSMQKMPTL